MLLMEHLFGTAVRAFFRMLASAIVAAAVGGGAVLGVAYQSAHAWPPNRLTDAAAIAVAVLAAYGTALTVLVREAVRGVRIAEKTVINAADQAAHEVEHRDPAHA